MWFFTYTISHPRKQTPFRGRHNMGVPPDLLAAIYELWSTASCQVYERPCINYTVTEWNRCKGNVSLSLEVTQEFLHRRNFMTVLQVCLFRLIFHQKYFLIEKLDNLFGKGLQHSMRVKIPAPGWAGIFNYCLQKMMFFSGGNGCCIWRI